MSADAAADRPSGATTADQPHDRPGDSADGPLDAALERALAALAAGDPCLLMLDIDGTLAPIARRPEDARVPPRTLAALARLARAPRTRVVLVTGRPPDAARALVALPGLWIVGNHGAELVTPDGTHHVDPQVVAHAEPIARAADVLQRLADVPGVRVEDKRWSLTIHTRLAPREALADVEAAVRAVADREGLRVSAGKEVLELKAPVPVDKGTAALALAARLGGDRPGATLLFAGDDVTDEDAFRRLADARPDAVTVRVGPPDAPTAARFRVADPAAVCALLERLAPV